MDKQLNIPIHKSVLTRHFFRYWGIYFLTYFILGRFSSPWKLPAEALGRWWGVCEEISIMPNGSGDTTFNYLQIPLLLFTALIITSIVISVDRKNTAYNQILYWLWTITRYCLAFYLLLYGLGKVNKLQFPDAPMYRLLERVGDMSPMGLAWTYMGYSKGFNIVVGLAEVVPGILLLFRRTTLLGALLAMVVMGNVVAINFCFDIPVKLFSTHLFLAAVYIAAPFAQRLMQVLLGYKNIAELKQFALKINDTGPKIAIMSVKIVISLLLLVMSVNMLKRDSSFANAEENVPLYGLYEAKTFIYKGDTLPPLITDTFRWRYLMLEYKERATVKTMNDSLHYYKIRVGSITKGITMTDRRQEKSYWHYSYTPDSLLVFKGVYDDSVEVYLKKIPISSFRLKSRGFHWVNEYPYNR